MKIGPLDYNEERPHSSLAYRTPKEFAAQSAVVGFYSAGVGQKASNAGPLPSPLKPEMGQKEFVVCSSERMQGQVNTPPNSAACSGNYCHAPRH
jgi:hypothetical protein